MIYLMVSLEGGSISGSRFTIATLERVWATAIAFVLIPPRNMGLLIDQAQA